MHPAKFVFLILLLFVVVVLCLSVFGRSERYGWLVRVSVAAFCVLMSIASAGFGVRAISTGFVSLSKHGGALTFSLLESPIMFVTLVAFLFLLAVAMLRVAIFILNSSNV